MAGLAQGYAGVLPALLDVVSVRGRCFVAHTAGKLFDLLQVLAFCFV
jgi:hypothetical protein